MAMVGVVDDCPKQFETIVFFCDFQSFGGIQHFVQCLFFEIWCPLRTMTTDPFTLHFVHVCGVNIIIIHGLSLEMGGGGQCSLSPPSPPPPPSPFASHATDNANLPSSLYPKYTHCLVHSCS